MKRPNKINFGRHGFHFFLGYRKNEKTNQKEETCECTFLGLHSYSLTILLHLKNVFGAFLYNKLGSIKRGTQNLILDKGEREFKFYIKRENEEILLHCESFQSGKGLKMIDLDYLQVSTLKDAVTKAASTIHFNENDFS